MDGTLTLTEPLHHQAYSTVFKKYGVDFTFDEEIKKYAGSGSHAIFAGVFAERGIKVSDEEIEQCAQEKKKLYAKIVHESEIVGVPGVQEFLQRPEVRKLKKIIATGNSNLDAVRFMLQKAGISEHFSEMVSVGEVARGKPFPDVFLEAARRINCEASACVVFEDAINGVTAAKAAGMRAFALETTTAAADLKAAGADTVFRSYLEIPTSNFL